MKTTPKYVVKSQTNRSKQGRPDLCWMNISTEKLNECCAAGEKFYFECEIGGSSYRYFIDGTELKKALLSNDVATMGKGMGPERYSFYVHYLKGEVYDKLSEAESKLVCRLQSLARSNNA